MGTQPRTGFERVEVPEPNAPVASPDEPTDEQLENLAVHIGFPMMATPLMRRLPHWRTSMLNLHGLVQRVADGNEGAAHTLAALRSAFGEPTSAQATAQQSPPKKTPEGGSGL